jgi:hypothetical protein
MNKKLSEEISGLRARLETCRKELHKEKQKEQGFAKKSREVQGESERT